MMVEIINCTPDFLKTIWCAARTCYSPLTPQELWRSDPTEEEKLRIARHIFHSRHMSVVEHCVVTFAVSGVSRTLLAQYSRHRIGVSLSVQSQRYVSERSGRNGQPIFDAVVPSSIRQDPEALAEYRKQLQNIQDSYDRLCELGIPKEDARFVLPGGAETNFVTTVNLRSLLDLYQKRVAVPGAQWEIRQMVQTMMDLVVNRFPWLEEFLEPPKGTLK
ncbi:MAG: FAD-dependent thymidylate synthase [Firmicutes bacterium]|nr:FAD-dependent thymidylate synthase [Bacillota bacterium]